ncbi:MAG: hypothetical protein AAF380_03090 [Bacteroidota bacterium]
MSNTMKWLEEAKKRDYELYKNDREAYYAELKECGIWLKKHLAAVNRLAYHIWPTAPSDEQGE